MSYPGLRSDRYHNLAKRYCPKGAGAVFTFGLKGGYDAGRAARLEPQAVLATWRISATPARWSSTRPRPPTASSPTSSARVAGAGPEVVRLSIGLEDTAGPHRRPRPGARRGIAGPRPNPHPRSAGTMRSMVEGAVPSAARGPAPSTAASSSMLRPRFRRRPCPCKPRLRASEGEHEDRGDGLGRGRRLFRGAARDGRRRRAFRRPRRASRRRCARAASRSRAGRSRSTCRR